MIKRVLFDFLLLSLIFFVSWWGGLQPVKRAFFLEREGSAPDQRNFLGK